MYTIIGQPVPDDSELVGWSSVDGPSPRVEVLTLSPEELRELAALRSPPSELVAVTAAVRSLRWFVQVLITDT